jgi:RNA polymerase sigma-70 factor (ECF subfamily)
MGTPLKKVGRIREADPSYKAVGAEMTESVDQGVEETYRRYYPVIRLKCERMLKDPVEASDVAQEVFVRLWSERAKIHDPLAVTAWLYRTATHLVVDRIRGRRTTAFDERTLIDLMPEAPGDPELDSHARSLLRGLVSDMPAEELKAAILARIDGLTQPELAEVLGVSERTVRRMLAQFEERLERWRKRRGAAC